MEKEQNPKSEENYNNNTKPTEISENKKKENNENVEEK